MIHRFAIAIVSAVAPVVIACAAQDAGGRDAAGVQLRVLAINDFHGQLEPLRPEFGGCRELGGADVLARHLDHARAATSAPVIAVDGGDSYHRFGGEDRSGEAVAFLNRIGVAAAALGNHELGPGAGVLRERKAEARFPWLASNVHIAGTAAPPEWLKSTHVTVAEACGRGDACVPAVVGFAGVTTALAARSPSPVLGDLEVGDLAPAMDEAVRSLRARGVDFVIGLAHAGGGCGTAGDGCQGEVIELAERLRNRPDLIVAGHTHTLINTVVNGIPIVQAESRGTRFSIVDLERDEGGRVAVHIRGQPRTYADSLDPDNATAATLAECEAKAAERAYAVVASLSAPARRAGPVHLMANLVADAHRAATGADVAVVNSGAVRAELPAGPVTEGDLFRVQPFGNRLVVLEATGALLLEIAERALSAAGEPIGHFSGLVIEYDPTAPDGSRVVAAALTDGRPLEPDRVYLLAANEYIAAGGASFEILSRLGVRRRSDATDLEALVEHLRHHPAALDAASSPRLRPVAR